MKVFVPARDFAESRRFYLSLGFTLNWEHEDNLAEFELGGTRFWLQNFYVQQWADNFMISIDVDDAASWFKHISEVLETEDFEFARVKPPKRMSWGSLVTYAWDPSGVLIHFSQHPAPE